VKTQDADEHPALRHASIRLPALLIIGILSATDAHATCPPRDSWPAPDWPVAQPAPARETDVAELRQYLLSPEARARGIQTDGLLIVRGGRIVFEEYARGYARTMRHLGWSVSKTFTNALTGRAVALQALSIDDSICRYRKGVRADNCDITVRSLLDMSSGLDWHEATENPPTLDLSVVEMLFRDGRKDMAAYVAGLPRRAPPGATWEYSSGDLTLLASVVQAAMEPRYGHDFPWSVLLDRIGAGNVTWERDDVGTLIGGSFLWATPRDLARLGYLYLNDGCWNGERLLPEGWGSGATRVNEAFRRQPLFRNAGDVYGRELWLNRPVPELGQPQPWPSVPPDAFAATGKWNQIVLVIPSLDLIIVRTGDDRIDGALDVDRFFKLAIQAGLP
jgi:CubicO group peptidase (beta-lactamase class C family)